MNLHKGVGASCIRLTALLGVIIASTLVQPIASHAQDAAKKPAAKNNKNQSAWIKVCEKNKLKLSKDAEPELKELCMTLQETINKFTGGTLISAAIRKVEGVTDPKFLVTVPLGVILPVGVEIKIDENKPLRLPFSICHQGGCVAEIKATDELLNQMLKGTKMVATPRDGLNGKLVPLPISLNGFAKAYKGKSFDMKKYVKNRQAISQAILKKRIEMAKKFNKVKEAEKVKANTNTKK